MRLHNPRSSYRERAAFIFPTSNPTIDFSGAKRATTKCFVFQERESLYGRMFLQEKIRTRESEH